MKKLFLFFFMLLSCFLNGQNAQDIIDELKIELKSNPDEKRQATIYSDLTWYYSNISLDSAMIYGNKAIDKSLKLGDSTIIAQAYGDVSTVYLKKGQYDESLKYLQKVLFIRKKRNDILGVARVYAGIGLLYNNKSKYQLSMKNYLLALEYANKANDDKTRYNIQNAMSSLLLDLKDYKKALLYSEQAIKFFERSNSKLTLCTMYVNNGNIYLGLKDTLNALKMYEKAKLICQETGNKLSLSKALNNIGSIKEAQNKTNDSKILFQKTKEIRNELNSDFLNYKYKFNEVERLNKKQKFAESKIILLELKSFFNSQKDYSNLLNSYKLLIPVTLHLNEKDSVVFYQKKFLELNSEIEDSNILKKTIELETKYQTEKKEKQILKQQADAKQKNIWLLLISSIAIIGLLLFRNQVLKTKQQKNQAKLEKELLQEQSNYKIQEQRLDISRELHDNVGSQLTFIISILDNLKSAPVKFDENSSKKIESVSNFANKSIAELRDTIWVLNSKSLDLEELKNKMLNYIKDASESVENTKFDFSFDVKNNVQLSSKQAINTFRVLQEIVNNALKHANSSQISVTITQNQNNLEMEIQDNGVGFNFEEKKKKSFGLTNIQNRVQEINGTLNVHSEQDSGTNYLITIKL